MNRITLEDPGDFLDWREGSGGTIEVFDIAVGSERRTGKGRRLMEQLFAIANKKNVRTVFAITRADNLIAQHFYEGLVFEVSGVLRRFYRDRGNTVDAVLYARSPRGPV